MGLSLPHLLVIALILFLLFGANRFPNMMGDLAKGIKSFKHGMKDEDDARPETRPEVKTFPRADLPRTEDVPRAPMRDTDPIEHDLDQR